MNGGSGNDTLLSSSGGGITRGGDGNDTIRGYGLVLGDAGSDTFVYDATSSYSGATIGDFTRGEDKMDLSALDIDYNNLSFIRAENYLVVFVVDDAGNYTGQGFAAKDVPFLLESDFLF
ncbi:hypothetical protein F1C10_03910 [Sphingomonas sp. NBWT7]|nr:hypothetical protein F1C10_03910 [Sphingomonas sp. NBWT7]